MSDDTIRVRLLGPVEIRGGAGWRGIASAKQRTLLAILAINRATPVSVDRLVDDLWGASPPRNPANQLQVLVYRLRQVLGDHDANVLQTLGFGYALMLADDQTDIAVFESVAARAAQALREDQPKTAMELCADGLGLWRGDPFADTTLPDSITADAAGLAEERLVLHETFLDAALLLGRHAELVSELTQATTEHPFREHYWAQLILCYYRCGRQAEALDAYRRVYGLLGEQIGVEPGQELQRLHQRILAADPELLDVKHAPLPASPPSNRQVPPLPLPTAMRHFVGRSALLKQLVEIFDTARATSEPAIAVITGNAGVGKTALAVYWAHWMADQFADGHLYINLRGFDPSHVPANAYEAMADLVLALGVTPDRIPPTEDAKLALYRNLMANRRILLILDNARDAAQVRPLLPGGTACMVLVTSRNPLAGLMVVEGADLISLDVFSADEAQQLFTSYLGAERVDAERDAVAAVTRQCAHLPLALAIAASRAAVVPAMTISSLAADLNDAQQRLDALNTGEAVTDVKTVLSWSYHAASPAAQRMFRLLSVHPGPDISVEAAARLADVSGVWCRRLLSELATTRLITEHNAGRYGFHDLLRAYSVDLAKMMERATRRHAMRRVLDYYLEISYLNALALEPDLVSEIQPIGMVATAHENLADPRQALAWFDAEYRILLGLVDSAAASGYLRHAWQLSWTLTDYFRRRGHWHDWVSTQRTALAAAEQLDDRSAQGHAHRSLARAYCWLTQFEKCHHHLSLALSLFAAADDVVGQAHVLRNLAYVYERFGHDDLALSHAERALRRYEAAGHATGRARALNTVGWYKAKSGDAQSALIYCEKALGLLQAMGHRSGEAATWDSLGYARYRLGQQRDAISCFERAIEILNEIGDRDSEADTLSHLADAYRADGDDDRARECWRRALTILIDLSHPDAKLVSTKLTEIGPDQ
jgi:DNA-binding SARP family transcriptional activator/Tfp pilus assembly protein PilF